MSDSGVDQASLKRVLKNLDTEVKKIENGTKEGCIHALTDIMRQSMKIVPVAYGNLRASSFITWGNKIIKRRGNFVNNPDTGITAGQMSSQHSSLMSDIKSVHDDNSGTAGYSAIYALKVHENPRSGVTGGASLSGKKYPIGSFATRGQWKFLETPLKNTSKVLGIIAKYAKKSID